MTQKNKQPNESSSQKTYHKRNLCLILCTFLCFLQISGYTLDNRFLCFLQISGYFRLFGFLQISGYFGFLQINGGFLWLFTDQRIYFRQHRFHSGFLGVSDKLMHHSYFYFREVSHFHFSNGKFFQPNHLLS